MPSASMGIHHLNAKSLAGEQERDLAAFSQKLEASVGDRVLRADDFQARIEKILPPPDPMSSPRAEAFKG